MRSATLQHLPIPWGSREALSSKYHWFRLLHPCWPDVTLVTSFLNKMYINLIWGCSKGLSVHNLVKIVWHPTWLERAWASPTLASKTRSLSVYMYIYVYIYIYMVRLSIHKYVLDRIERLKWNISINPWVQRMQLHDIWEKVCRLFVTFLSS